MRWHVLAVGRLKAGPLPTLCADYAKRCTYPLALHEVQAKRRDGSEQQSDEEAALLLAALPAGARVVVLDERGDDLSSRALAGQLGRWRDQAVRDVAFLLGGADGHGAAVRDRADLSLAFGRATWPHQLVRVMLYEQLYRAGTLLTGHPYHRD